MVGIFAIIAIIGQGKFAIIAIDFVAIIAKCSGMNDLDMKNKIWLAGHLSGIAHGDRGKVAAAVGITSTQLSRMANVDPAAAPKNTQNIPLPKLLEFAKYFRDLPPGIVEALTYPDFKTTIEPKSSVTAEIIKHLDGLPLHLRESLLTIVESWTPAGEGSETDAEPHPPSHQGPKRSSH